MNFNKYMKTKNINYALMSLIGFLFIAFPLNINAEDEIKSESCSLGNISRSIELFTGDFKQGSYFVKVTGDSVNQSFIAIKE